MRSALTKLRRSFLFLTSVRLLGAVNACQRYRGLSEETGAGFGAACPPRESGGYWHKDTSAIFKYHGIRETKLMLLAGVLASSNLVMSVGPNLLPRPGSRGLRLQGAISQIVLRDEREQITNSSGELSRPALSWRSRAR